MKIRSILTYLFPLMLLSAFAMALPDFAGFSGAPGSNGNCASSCHGTTGGTITVSGFPAEYEPGQNYTIMIAHDGGSSIGNFNSSIRIGNGSDNAGVIGSGTNTTAYSVGVETNGVHFTTSNHDVGDFVWTAPEAGTGAVTLYLAGLQGSYSGQNTELVISSSELGGFVCGDANGSGSVNILDITFIIAYLYSGGPAPDPIESGDVNSSGSVNILDITYIISFLYGGGPAPVCP